MNLKTYLYLVFVLLLLCSSCMSHLYVPEPGNTLQLSKKNDLKLSADGFFLKKNKNIDEWFLKRKYQYINLQFGYSPIKHIGIIANHFRINAAREFDNPPYYQNNFGTGRMSNIAIGGYYFLNKKTNNSRKKHIHRRADWLVEVYAGYGEGHLNQTISNLFVDNMLNHSFDIRKYYLQTGIHWKMKNIEISYQIVTGKLDYFNGSLSGKINSNYFETLQRINKNEITPFYQNNFIFSKKFKAANVYASLSVFSIDTTTKILEPPNLLFQIGGNLNINEVLRSLKKEKPYKLY